MYKGLYLLALSVQLEQISELCMTKFWEISVTNSEVVGKRMVSGEDGLML